MTLPSQSVSVRPPSDQPFFAFAIAGLSCTLSLWLTLRFCRQLWPEEGGLLLVLLGLTWESAKLYFGPIGVRGLGVGEPGQRLGSLLLATMALVLMAGSVVASMAYLSQADAQDQQRALTSSRAYAESQELLRSLDAQIGVLSVAAARDVDQNFRKRALATSEAISDLRHQRAEASAAIAKMETHPEVLASTPFFASTGALLPGDAAANGKRIRCGAHAVIAVMLELIGVAALSVARGHAGTSRSNAKLGTGRYVGGSKATEASNTDVEDNWSEANIAIAREYLAHIKDIVATARDTKPVKAMRAAGTVPDTRPPRNVTESAPPSPDTFVARDTSRIQDTTPDTLPVADTTRLTGRIENTISDALAVAGAIADTPNTITDTFAAGRRQSTMPDTPRAADVIAITPDTISDTFVRSDTRRLQDTIPDTPPAPDTMAAPDTISDTFAGPDTSWIQVTTPITLPVADTISNSLDTKLRGTRRDATADPLPARTKLGNKVSAAKLLVAENQIAPTCRSFMEALRIGQAAARYLLAELHSEGLLKRVGRRYELVA